LRFHDDSAVSFSAAILLKRDQPPFGSLVLRQPVTRIYLYMKAELVKAALEAVPNQQILVNMVSRRVRQLCMGHRPLVEFAPGLGHADVALTEIASKKLTYESTFGQNGKDAPAAQVVQFPGIIVSKKKAA